MYVSQAKAHESRWFSGISYHRRHTQVSQSKHTKHLFEAHTCVTGKSTGRFKLSHEAHSGFQSNHVKHLYLAHTCFAGESAGLMLFYVSTITPGTLRFISQITQTTCSKHIHAAQAKAHDSCYSLGIKHHLRHTHRFFSQTT